LLFIASSKKVEIERKYQFNE